MTNLAEKYRPKLDEVVGQPAAVRTLRKYLKDGNFPQVVMFTGPSGTGKTSLAYACAAELGMERDLNLYDINCGVVEPIQCVRDVHQQTVVSRCRPLTAERHGWVFDEIQTFSRAKGAQEAMLKVLEHPPSWAYFFLATTDPQRVLRTVRARCQTFELKLLDAGSLTGLLDDVARAEKHKLPVAVRQRVVELSQGSARDALLMLEKTIGLKESDALESLCAVVALDAGKSLAQILLGERQSPKWKDVADVLRSIPDSGAEGARRGVLGYAEAILLGSGTMTPKGKRADAVISVFRDNTYDTGRPLLTQMCAQLFGKN